MPPDEVVDNTGSSLPTSSSDAPPPAAPALTNPTAIVEGPRDVSDDDLISALSSSRENRPAETPETGEGEKAAAAPAATQKPAETPVDPKVAAQVDAAVKARADAAEARERELKPFRDQGARMVQEAEAYAAQRKQQADREYTELIADLRKDPIAAAKKAGWDPVALVENIANYDTPQGRIEREMLATKAELAEFKREQQQRDAAAKQQQERSQQAQLRSEVENTFLTELKTKYPGAEEHLKRPGMQEFFLQQANKRADELIAERGGGGSLTYGEVAEWLGTTYGFGQAPAPPKGAPAQTAAGKAARGLTQTAQSERSGGESRKFHELSEAEQDRILVAEQKQREATRRAQQR